MTSIHVSIKSLLLLIIATLYGCASTTLLETQPSNAKVYINDEYQGTSPFYYTDKKPTGSVTDLRFEKDGFEPFVTRLHRNEEFHGGAVFGGLLLMIPMWWWCMEYKEGHKYALKPLNTMASSLVLSNGKNETGLPNPQKMTESKSKILLELKDLQDKQIISAVDYDSLKLKTLNDGLIELTDSKKAILVSLNKMKTDSLLSVAEYEKIKQKTLYNTVAIDGIIEKFSIFFTLKNSLQFSDDELKRIKESIISNGINLEQLNQLCEFVKLHKQQLLSDAELKKEKRKTIRSSWVIGDSVVFTNNTIKYVGVIRALDNKVANVGYTEHYMFGDAEETIKIKITDLEVK